jgi:hypothetical protein
VEREGSHKPILSVEFYGKFQTPRRVYLDYGIGLFPSDRAQHTEAKMKYADIEDIKRMLDDPDTSLAMLTDLEQFVKAKIEAWGKPTKTQKQFRIV